MPKYREKITSVLIVTLGFCASFLIVFLAQAQDVSNPSLTGKFIEGKDISEWINMVYIWGVGIIGVLAVLVLVFAGITYITSAGNPEMINKAKSQITAALAGVVILLLSYTILHTIDPRLTKLEFIVEKLELPSNPTEKATVGAEYSGTVDGKSVDEAKENCKKNVKCQGISDDNIYLTKNEDGSWKCECAQGSQASCEAEPNPSEENCAQYTGASVICVFDGKRCVATVNEEQKKKLACKEDSDCESGQKCNTKEEGPNINLCYTPRARKSGEVCNDWPSDICEADCNRETGEHDYCTGGGSDNCGIENKVCDVNDNNCCSGHVCLDLDGVRQSGIGTPLVQGEDLDDRCYKEGSWSPGTACDVLLNRSASNSNLIKLCPYGCEKEFFSPSYCRGSGDGTIPKGGWCGDPDEAECAGSQCTETDEGLKCQ